MYKAWARRNGYRMFISVYILWCTLYLRSSDLQNLLPHGLGAQFIGPIQLPIKMHISSLCIFLQAIACLFSACEWQTLSFAFQKGERQPTLIISFSDLWGAVKKFKLKSHWCHTLPGELARESVTKCPHKDAFCCINITNIYQYLIIVTFNGEESTHLSHKGHRNRKY